MYPDGSHWITLEDGQHVLLGADGTILVGLGPQNKGKTFAEVFADDIIPIKQNTVFNTGGDIGREPASPEKAQEKIATKLAKDIGNNSVGVYEFGEGSLRRQRISMNRQTEFLSGGRTQHTDIEIDLRSPKKVMGYLKVSQQESNGIDSNGLTYNKSAYSREFLNYEELKTMLQSLSSY